MPISRRHTLCDPTFYLSQNNKIVAMDDWFLGFQEGVRVDQPGAAGENYKREARGRNSSVS